MKNKGFTLVELIATITILGIIALIAMPSVMKSFNKSKNQTMVIQENKLIEAGDILVDDYCKSAINKKYKELCDVYYQELDKSSLSEEEKDLLNSNNIYKYICVDDIKKLEYYTEDLKYGATPCQGVVVYEIDSKTKMQKESYTYVKCEEAYTSVENPYKTSSLEIDLDGIFANCFDETDTKNDYDNNRKYKLTIKYAENDLYGMQVYPTETKTLTKEDLEKPIIHEIEFDKIKKYGTCYEAVVNTGGKTVTYDEVNTSQGTDKCDRKKITIKSLPKEDVTITIVFTNVKKNIIANYYKFDPTAPRYVSTEKMASKSEVRDIGFMYETRKIDVPTTLTEKINGRDEKFNLVYRYIDGNDTPDFNGTIDIGQNDRIIELVYQREEFNVTYNNNGGTGCETGRVKYNKPYGTLCKPTRAGYDFAGWSLTPNGATLSKSDKTDIDNIKKKNENYQDITLYATWEAKTYTITYYLGNASSTVGSTSIGTSTCKYGETCKLKSFKKTIGDGGLGKIFPYSYDDEQENGKQNYGWSFYGWSTSQTDLTKEYSEEETFTYTVVGNTKLYAIGKRNMHINGGVAPTSSYAEPVQYWNPYGITDAYVTEVELPTGRAIEGWTFLGFKCGDNTASSSVTLASNLAGTKYKVPYNKYPYTRSIYKRTLTVSYNSNGGSGTISNQTGTQYYNSGYGTSGSNKGNNVSKVSFTLANNSFTNSGNSFKGWIEDSLDGDVHNAGATYEFAPQVGSTETSKTFYAKWDANTYTITYYLGNASSTVGSTSIGTSSCTYGKTCNLKSFSEMSKEFPYSYEDEQINGKANYGWSFYGWSTSQTDLTREYTNNASFTYNTVGNIKLYAIGTRNMHINGGIAPTSSYAEPVQYWNPYGITEAYLTEVDIPTAKTISGWTFIGYKCGNSTANSSVTLAPSLAGTKYKIPYNTYPYTRSAYQRTLTISYNANGGSGTTNGQTNTQYYNSGFGQGGSNTGSNSSTPSFILRNNEFTKSGYTFKNWAEDSASGNEHSVGQTYSYGPAVNVTNTTKTFYAKWGTEEYRITYALNGGTNPVGVRVKYTVESETFELEEPTKTGYTFKGWYKESSFTNKVDKITKGSTGNITLYAKWEAITYTITYELDEGTLPSGAPTTYNIETETFEISTPAKTGHSFEGWYKDASHKTAISKINKGSTGNITLYAKWTPNQYEITYHVGNGTSTAGTKVIKQQTCTYGQTCTLETFSSIEAIFPYSYEDEQTNGKGNHGWKFAGWTNYEDTMEVKYEDGLSFKYEKTYDLDLYAMGERKLRINGGIAPTTPLHELSQMWNPYSTNTTYLTNVTLPAGKAITGWTFIGYRHGSDSVSGEVIYDSDDIGVAFKAPYNIWPHIRSVYQRTLTVSYNGNGASNTMSNQTKPQYYNSGFGTGTTNRGANVSSVTFTLSNNSFTKKGYTFSKWTEGSTSGTEYSAGSSYAFGPGVSESATKTFYAKWTTNTYTVKYSCGTGSGTVADKTVTYNSTYTVASKSCTKTGYVQSGWTTNSNETNDGHGWSDFSGTWTSDNGEKGISNKTLQLYPVWTANTYTVKHSCGTGSGTVADKKATYNSTYTAASKSCTKTGHVQSGWTTNSNETDDGYGWSNFNAKWTSVNGNKGINNSVLQLYPVWTPNTYTITYYLGNASSTVGSTSIGTSTCTYGSACQLKAFGSLSKVFPYSYEDEQANGKANYGWKFAGWSTSQTDLTTEYSNQETITYDKTSNLKLYAIGVRNMHFNGSIEPTSSYAEPEQYWNPYGITDTYLTNVSIPTSLPVNGWTFIGYRCGSSEASSTVTLASNLAGTSYKIPYNTYPYTRSVYQRAITVSYNKNDTTASGTMTAQTGTQYYNSGYGKSNTNHGAKINKPTFVLKTNEFTKRGYTFSKWALNSASGTQYSSGATIEFDNPVNIEGNKTAFAIWEKGKYTLTFNANGGSVSPSSKTITYMELLGELPTPTREGYEFVGWFTQGETAKHDSSKYYKDNPWLYYADQNSDLYSAYGYNQASLKNHYNQYGKTEGRRISMFTSTDANTTASNQTFYAGWYPLGTQLPSFTYTGQYRLLKDDNTLIASGNNSKVSIPSGYSGYIGDWKIKFLTNGTLTFHNTQGITQGIDVFLVGGGGGGTEGGAQKGGGGGGGGFTATHKGISVTSEQGYYLEIGDGGYGGTTDISAQNGESTSGFGKTVLGGNAANRLNWVHGAAGGSGGGSGGYYYSGTTKAPGSGGSYGSAGQSGIGDGGAGQGKTTCEFDEGDTTKCTNGDDFAYAGGGGGAGGYNGVAAAAAAIGGGGRGGNNQSGTNGYNGTPNTGGGGGGGPNSSVGGDGGSGIIVIRNAR